MNAFFTFVFYLNYNFFILYDTKLNTCYVIIYVHQLVPKNCILLNLYNYNLSSYYWVSFNISH